MKESQILFSGPMARALHRAVDPKTQTRRIVSGEALMWLEEARFSPEFVAAPENRLSPYGYAGDRLWVREAWRTNGDDGRCDSMPPRDLQPHAVWYEADGTAPSNECVGKYRPSMFMPRWASRIALDVIQVRVERLQDITEADAIAEGIYLFPGEGGGYKCDRGEQEYDTAREAYKALWDTLNAERGYGWDANPWLWVVEFKRIDA